jgi:hypothetical protein
VPGRTRRERAGDAHLRDARRAAVPGDATQVRRDPPGRRGTTAASSLGMNNHNEIEVVDRSTPAVSATDAEAGIIGWAFLWWLGVPFTVLLLVWLLFFR